MKNINLKKTGGILASSLLVAVIAKKLGPKTSIAIFLTATGTAFTFLFLDSKAAADFAKYLKEKGLYEDFYNRRKEL